jgi:hypothetical protein
MIVKYDEPMMSTNVNYKFNIIAVLFQRRLFSTQKNKLPSIQQYLYITHPAHDNPVQHPNTQIHSPS